MARLLSERISQFDHPPTVLGRRLTTGMIAVGRTLSGELGRVTRDTLADAVDGLASFTRAVSPQHARMLDDAGIRRSIVSMRLPRIVAERGKTMTATVILMHRVLQKLLSPVDKTVPAASALLDALSSEWWRVERTVRTETSSAYNEALAHGIRLLGSEDPALMQRWTENIDDQSGKPLDEALSPDSIAMHGQIVRPGYLFHMPKSATNVPLAMRGKGWYYPPNRPNDRALVIPWHPRWGIPAWHMERGLRVQDEVGNAHGSTENAGIR